MGFIFIIFFVISCVNKKDSLREVSIYYGSELNKTETFKRSVSKNKNLLIYRYESQKDSSKVITIRYDKSSKELMSMTDNFIKTKGQNIKEQSISNEEFSFFISKNSNADSTGPIIFNQDYGLLAINNSFGPTIIFLRNKKDKEIRNRIFKKLTE